MRKTPGESDDSRTTRPRSEKSPRQRARAKVAAATPFDVDAWEPSLLERMLKANGRKHQDS